MVHRVALIVVFAQVCGGAGEPGAGAAVPPSTVSVVEGAGSPVAVAAGEAAAPPEAARDEAAPASGGDPAALVGWWRSPAVCLELFANGDFELSLQSSEPKVQVLGAATVTPAQDGFMVALAVQRIWRARFTSPCRKHHELGRWAESEQALGVTFTPGASASLRLRRIGEAQVELCGETCATLTRETPALSGRWRREGMEYPDRPEVPWSPGDLLELEFGEHGHVWAGRPQDGFGTAYGEARARFVANDRFTVEFTAERYSDVPPGTVPAVFGEALAVGVLRTWSARRLAGERLEVCGEQGACATLVRQFDAYHHDL